MMAESSSSSSGWEFVDKEGRSLENSDDNQSETSESSIEVVSMDTSDPQSLESVQEPPLPSPTSGSYLILRLRSKEKDSLTESDESDHQGRDQGSLKRRKKSKAKFPRPQEPSPLSSGLLTASEEERDFETIPDPQKEKAEVCTKKEKETVEDVTEEEIQNSLQRGEIGSMQSFQVLDAPSIEDQEPLNLPPFNENGGVDQGSREEDEDFMFLGVPQDDPDTESSPEMADEQDDRIESDRSEDRHSDDFSTLSNVDISDLMAEDNLIRQYVFRPNPSVNVTLNLVMVVVISIAVGLGIGHAIGTAKERFVNMNLREMSVNMDEDGHCQFDMEDVEKLTVENIELKKEANKAQNEVVDLRSEVMKLRYSSIVTSAEEEKRTANKKNLELKVEVNKLQHENEDLKKLVGSLKYGSHPGNEEGKMFDEESQMEDYLASCSRRQDHENDEMEEETKDSIIELNVKQSTESPSDGQREGDKKHVSIIDVVHPFAHNLDIDYHVTESSQEDDIEDNIDDENDDNERSSEQISQSESEIEEMPGYFPCSSHKNKADRPEESEKQQVRELNVEYPGTNTEKVLKCDALEGESEESDRRENVNDELLWEDTSEIKSESMEDKHEDIEEDVEILDEDLGDEVVEDEDVSNTSSENIRYTEEQPKTESGGQGTEEKKKESSQSSVKIDWRETMHKILNKTKASVSVVSQQIQDTWKQVKNMSEDLWKKNEPVLTKLKSNVVTNVKEATQKISEKLEGARNWLRHHRPYPRHRQNDNHHTEKKHRHKNHHWRNQREDKYPKHKQNDDMYREKRNKRDSKFYKATTGRRSYKEERDDDKPWGKHNRKAERFERKRERKFNKIKRRFEKMHEYQFCKMNMKKRQKFFNILEDFDERFSADKMLDDDHRWYSCQWDWWWNAMSFHLNNFMLMDPSCQGTLLPWQEGILISGRWECLGFSQNLKKDDQFTFKFDDDEEDDDDGDDDNNDESNKKHFNSMPYFDDLNLQQTNNDTEEFRGCDPTKGLCDYDKNDSWYLKKMKFRQYQRYIDTTEKGKTEWMFARANYRRHERERTDCSPGVHGVYVCG
ncbi:uncharacterized protein LOC134263545 [Saccostrea cucullata]|uniref:uncharacterized protein LOC134263545 n=1 Tax=Saccostrea cuccullata TaxID=36930 RepID=UPI002ED2189B